MSKVANDRRNGLEEIKDDAEKLTLRRLEDEGFEFAETEAPKTETKTAKK